MVIELLSLLIMPGMTIAGVAMLRDDALPRWQGALVVVLAPAAWLPFGGLAVGAVLSVMMLTASRRVAPLDSAARSVAG